MNIRYTFYIIMCGLAIVAASCVREHGMDASGTSVADSSHRVVIERFDRFLRDYPDMDTVKRGSLTGVFAPAVMFMERLTGETSADSMLMRLASSQVVEVFQPDVESRLGDLTRSEVAFGDIKDQFAKRLPAVNFPKRIFGIVTPYEQSLVIADTVIFIGLNHYLGSDYDGYDGFDEYRRRLKKQSRLPYDFAEALIYTSFPYDGGGRSTAASRMLYEGAVVKAILETVAGSTPADALGYTPQQYEWAEDNESELWRTLVGRQMLYSVDPTVGERLVAPAPYTSVVSPDSPGRIGRFVGLKLVESYLERHPEAKLTDLLSPGFYGGEGAVVNTGYSPK